MTATLIEQIVTAEHSFIRWRCYNVHSCGLRIVLTISITLFSRSHPDKQYGSLENLDTRASANDDPRLFLDRYPDGAIFDEVQHCPNLLSYMQAEGTMSISGETEPAMKLMW